MSKRKAFTKKEIQYDLEISRRLPKEVTRATYRLMTVPFGVLGLLLGVVSVFHPVLGLTGLCVLVGGWTVGGIVFSLIRRAKRRRAVCIDDYEIVRAFLQNSEKESYWISRHTSRMRSSRREASLYTFHFDGRKPFRLPKDNYTWDKERPMSDFFLYESCRRGEEFFLVCERVTGEIAMVYPLAFFDYKEN